MAFYTKPIIMEVSRSNQWPLRTELARHILPQPASGAPRQSNQPHPGTAYGRVEHRNNPTNPHRIGKRPNTNNVDYRTANCSKPQQSGPDNDMLSALYIPLCTSLFRLARPRKVPLPLPCPQQISNEFPRGRLLAPMKFN